MFFTEIRNLLCVLKVWHSLCSVRFVTSCRIACFTNYNVWLSGPEAFWLKAEIGKQYWSVKNWLYINYYHAKRGSYKEYVWHGYYVFVLNVSLFQKNLQSITLASKFSQWSIRSKLFQLMILFVILSVAELLLPTFPDSRLHKVFNYKFTMIFSRTYDI